MVEVGVHVFPTPLGCFVDLVHDAEMRVPMVSRSQYISQSQKFCGALSPGHCLPSQPGAFQAVHLQPRLEEEAGTGPYFLTVAFHQFHPARWDSPRANSLQLGHRSPVGQRQDSVI